ncbi:HEPN/Toprim-associated domain-containing protein [Pseudomonas sp. H3(2019)]|uniref:HEPN/Toprim-associated domain-containing protein n=1 Tax=Pseudomonas sp. H3(2019) TaxID=2598724 RepID=UPI0011977013|nr:HEPN/Toprim-associated domain-containing protein [Pseudomonas sp. H3(2019)]TVT83975.1 hypothetical protein FPT12_10205 [Pseudomonas sp. H3(2019)]
MSSWAAIELGGMSIIETQNHFYMWYFRKSERVIVKGSDTDEPTYKFVMSGETLRRRLELDGHNIASLRLEFDQQLAQMKKDCLDMIAIDPDSKAKTFLPVLESSTLSDWLTRLRRIRDEELEPGDFGQPDKEFGDPLLNFMLSVEGYYFSDHPGAGGHHFPCQSPEGYAIALLEVLPKDVKCELDISALISGGWTDAFDDLVESQQEFTSFYALFKSSLEEVMSLALLAPTNEPLARMLYASVITAMETYLSDTLRKQVFVKPAIKRRFVENHGKFKGNQLDLCNIYTRLESLDSFITKVIDEESFHSIVSVQKLYKNVLLTEISKPHMDKLVRAVSIRHDIVHRNGKSLQGDNHKMNMEDARQLVDAVDAAVRHIDKQIKDGLLDEIEDDFSSV